MTPRNTLCQRMADIHHEQQRNAACNGLRGRLNNPPYDWGMHKAIALVACLLMIGGLAL